MDIVVSPKSQIPLYEQVFSQISSQIIRGEIPPNYCLPSIRTIAKELDISIITVKSAWEKLEKEGYIYTLAGKGCFVAPYFQHNLDNKKYLLAKEFLKKNMLYYNSLGIDKEELIDIIKQLED